MKMKLLIAIWVFFALSCSAQVPSGMQVKNAGIIYTNGAPNIVPVIKTGSEIAIDTFTGKIYQWHRVGIGGSWLQLGQGIDVISGCISPAYTPARNQSRFAINGCDSLYYYRSGAWRHINKGGGSAYTAGDGIDITGNVISNTGLLASTEFGGDVSGTFDNLLLGNSGVTAGNYTNANITVNAQGIVTSAANGSGGISGSGSGSRIAYWDSGSSITSSSVLTTNGSAIDIGTGSYTGRLNVQGAGTSPSTYSIFIRDGSGNSYIYATDNGQLNVGKSTTFSSDVQFYPITLSGGALNFFNNFGNVFSSVGGFSGELYFNGSGSYYNARGVSFIASSKSTGSINNLQGGYFSARIGSASGRALSLIGVTGEATTNDATGGTTSSLKGVSAAVRNPNAGVLVTNAYGIVVEDITNGGTLTNSGGILIGDVSSGTQTNQPYSINCTDPNGPVRIAGKLGVGGAPSASAAFEVSSTTGGVLLPRLTTTQRDAIPSPVDGLIIYNATTNKVQARAAGVWVDLH